MRIEPKNAMEMINADEVLFIVNFFLKHYFHDFIKEESKSIHFSLHFQQFVQENEGALPPQVNTRSDVEIPTTQVIR